MYMGAKGEIKEYEDDMNFTCNLNLLTAKEEVELAKQRDLHRDNYYRTLLRSDHSLREFCDYLDGIVKRYEENKKHNRKKRKINERRVFAVKQIGGNVDTLRKIIERISGLGSSREDRERRRGHVRRGACLVHESLRIYSKYINKKERKLLNRLREEFGEAYEECEKYAAELKKEKQGERRKELEEKIFRLDEENRKKFGEDWVIKHGLMSRSFEIYEGINRELVHRNLRLVISIAKKYQGKGLDLAELIAEGNLGLMEGVEKYDYKRGMKVSTYVTHDIRKSIVNALKDSTRIIRVPRGISILGYKARKTGEELSLKSGKEASDGEIGEKIGESAESIRKARKAIGVRGVSLNRMLSGNDENGTFDFIADENDDRNRGQILLKNCFEKVLDESGLDWRERRIIEMRWGLNGYKEHTLTEAGRKLGLTRERIRQIQVGALRKLSHPRSVRKLERFRTGFGSS